MTTRWLVRAAPASRLPDDRDRVVTPPAEGSPPAPNRVALGARRRLRGGGQVIETVVDGWRFELEVEDADRAELRARATRGRSTTDGAVPEATGGPIEIRAMIPGRVAEVRVTAGDAVTAGQTLLVVEAMKMQNELRAPRDGVVDRVEVAAGSTIELGDVLVSVR